MSTTFWIIVGSALATYLTRIGGHLVLSRFEHVHPRVEAALNAVPAAVLTTLVAPSMLTAGPSEWAALVVSAGLSLRLGMLSTFLISGVVLVAMRHWIG